MRIRNKLFLAMAVPVGLLITQIVVVNIFIRELQSAGKFFFAAPTWVGAGFTAPQIVGQIARGGQRNADGRVREK